MLPWVLIAQAAILLVPGKQDTWFAEAHLVEVAPGPRINFYVGPGEKPGCPTATPVCRRRAYLVPGNVLVAGEEQGIFTHVTFAPSFSGRETSGWIETSALRPLATPVPRPEDWVGEWGVAEQDIEIRRAKKPSLYRIHGQATFGSLDPERIKRGTVNNGEFVVVAEIPNDQIAFAVDDPGDTVSRPLPYDTPDARDSICKIRIRLLGPYLLAQDNYSCGGANVTFTGIYRRK